MRIAQVKQAIGMNVIALSTTKPYTSMEQGGKTTLSQEYQNYIDTAKAIWIKHIGNFGEVLIQVISKKNEIFNISINPEHLDLRVNSNGALKIRLYDKASFDKAYQLLESLGYVSGLREKPYLAQYIYTDENSKMSFDYFVGSNGGELKWSDDSSPDATLIYFNQHKAKLITLSELNGLVAAPSIVASLEEEL